MWGLSANLAASVFQPASVQWFPGRGRMWPKWANARILPSYLQYLFPTGLTMDPYSKIFFQSSWIKQVLHSNLFWVGASHLWSLGLIYLVLRMKEVGSPHGFQLQESRQCWTDTGFLLLLLSLISLLYFASSFFFLIFITYLAAVYLSCSMHEI